MRTAAILTAAVLAGACAPTGAPVAPMPDVPFNGAQTCADRPAALVRGEPFYPQNLREAGQGGWVVLDYDILPDGSAANIVVVASNPPELFDGHARRALREWKFAAGAPRQKCRLDFKFSPKR